MLYINRVGYSKTFQVEHPKVAMYLPTKAQVGKQGPLSIDLVGEKDSVTAAVDTLSNLCAQMSTGAREVEVDSLRHKLIQTKGGKKLVIHIYLPSSLS